MKSETAYAVAFIQPGKPSTVVGAGVFGEPNPTTTNGIVPVSLFSEDADDYATAARRVGVHLSSNYYDWCGALKNSPTRGVYRDAR